MSEVWAKTIWGFLSQIQVQVQVYEQLNNESDASVFVFYFDEK